MCGGDGHVRYVLRKIGLDAAAGASCGAVAAAGQGAAWG
jgi:hypothetical protein